VASSESLRAVVAEIKTGEVTPESDVGWILISDFMACSRTLRDFVSKTGGQATKGKRRRE